MQSPLHKNNQNNLHTTDPTTTDLTRKIVGIGCVLPEANSPEFPEIEEMLGKCSVQFRKIPIKGEGVMYLLPESEVSKLPQDDEGHYLPVDEDGGHTIYRISQAYLDLMTQGLGEEPSGNS